MLSAFGQDGQAYSNVGLESGLFLLLACMNHWGFEHKADLVGQELWASNYESLNRNSVYYVPKYFYVLHTTS